MSLATAGCFGLVIDTAAGNVAGSADDPSIDQPRVAEPLAALVSPSPWANLECPFRARLVASDVVNVFDTEARIGSVYE